MTGSSILHMKWNPYKIIKSGPFYRILFKFDIFVTGSEPDFFLNDKEHYQIYKKGHELSMTWVKFDIFVAEFGPHILFNDKGNYQIYKKWTFLHDLVQIQPFCGLFDVRDENMSCLFQT